MSKLDTKTIAFNGAGIVLGVGLLAYVVKDALTVEQMPGCAERYPAGTEFSLIGRDGAPMSPVELQARTGVSSVGILENARVVQSNTSSGQVALQVNINSRNDVSDEAGDPRGIGFTWSPSGMQDATAACLTYQVWLPEKFEFGQGGSLFGLAGGSEDDGNSAIASRVEWRQGGQSDVRLKQAGSEKYTPANVKKFDLSTGRWSAVQQEVVLNTPGKSDGILRLWVNGDLVADRSDVTWRTSDAFALSHVQADIEYVPPKGRKKISYSSMLRLTPPVVSWR